MRGAGTLKEVWRGLTTDGETPYIMLTFETVTYPGQPGTPVEILILDPMVDIGDVIDAPWEELVGSKLPFDFRWWKDAAGTQWRRLVAPVARCAGIRPDGVPCRAGVLRDADDFEPRWCPNHAPPEVQAEHREGKARGS